MPSSSMRNAVLQATVLFTFNVICAHHLSANMFKALWEDEGFLNSTKAWERASPPSPLTEDRPARLALDAGENLNGTSSLDHRMNGTINAYETLPESFYGRVLPREVVIFFLLSILQYWWLVWLERMLPARPRHRSGVVSHKVEVEESEDREEEIVKKWIAQGRVNRASLNWCNTFLKWMLQLTIGNLWYCTTNHGLRTLLMPHSRRTATQGFASILVFSFVGSYLSVGPIYDLIAFIVVPAHKQIVFRAGADLLTTLFLTTLVRVVAVWAVKTEFVQTLMRNITELHSEEHMGGPYRYENEL